VSNVEIGVGRAWWEERIESQATAGKRLEHFLAALWAWSLVLIDVSVVLGAFVAAYWLRFLASEDAGLPALDLNRYAAMGLSISAITVVLFAHHGLYDGDRPLSWPRRLYVILSVLSTALVLSVTLTFFRNEEGFSRLWFATGWALSFAGLVLWRTVAARIHAWINAVAGPSNRVLIVGANTLGEELATELAASCQVVGFVDNGTDLDNGGSFPLLGPIARLDGVVHAHAIDEIVIALPPDRQEQAAAVIERGFGRDVTVKYVPNLGSVLRGRFQVQELAGHASIGFTPVPRVSWLKRALDIMVGSAVLVALSPLFLIVVAAIKLDSAGPVFYRQPRVGKEGRVFPMFKFRSMRQHADRYLEELREQNEASGPLFKMRRDPRITRVGRVLRRLSIDELPQLFNVLKGQMSLVGPRPPIPAEVDQYDEWQLGRLRAIPGMTGLWQVSGRSEVSFHDMVRLDLHYIRNWSLGLDLEILARTLPAVLSNRGAY
jgi:exopolysaccharide biosynthesis polyprenyl glycosylphosphotransferase